MKHKRVKVYESVIEDGDDDDQRQTTQETRTTSCKNTFLTCRPKLTSNLELLLLSLLVATLLQSTSAQLTPDDFGSGSGFSRFRFAPPASLSTGDNLDQPSTVAPAPSASNRSSPFVWQPLPLRATFRPLNRQQSQATSSSPSSPSAPQAPRAPRPPSPPSPPSPPPPPPEPLALISERSVSNSDSATDNLFPPATSSGRSSSLFSSSAFSDDFFTPTRVGADSGLFSSSSSSSNFFQPSTAAVTTTTTAAATASLQDFATTTTTTTPTPPFEVDEDTPTRQPMNRFRPTKAPTAAAANPEEISSRDNHTRTPGTNSTSEATSGRMSSECFDCMCEASTNCNARSRCQTSDVRHTRCGMFLISYDQWLATGLSRELVTREALARDAAADERAFYECVTQRECAERLLAIYMQRNPKDCDRDGRVDCYDYAAIHHSGLDQCASEQLLDSQYWTDFNACLGFGR